MKIWEGKYFKNSICWYQMSYKSQNWIYKKIGFGFCRLIGDFQMCYFTNGKGLGTWLMD